MTGPGVYNLSPGEYRGSLNLNLSSGQTLTINGAGAHLRDIGLASGLSQITVSGSGTLVVNNLNFHGGSERIGISVHGAFAQLIGSSFDGHQIGLFSSGSIVVEGGDFGDTNSGILIAGGASAEQISTANVSNSQFGSLVLDPFDNSKGILISGHSSVTVTNSTFERREFGIQVVGSGNLVANGCTFRECKNGVFGLSMNLDMGPHGAIPTLFENLLTNDSNPARGIFAGKDGDNPGSIVTLREPMHFKNIWNPDCENGLDEFSHGDGVSVLDGELTVISANPANFTFETIGRCFVVTRSFATISHVQMKDVVRGVLYAFSGTADRRTVLEHSTLDSSGIAFAKRHDAVSATNTFMTIRNNSINMTGGGVICVASNNADIFDNSIQNTKRNNISIAHSQRTHAGRNFLRTTIGDPLIKEGLDNIYIDRSVNVLIFENQIMDSNDNGVFCEGSEVTIRNNFIAGQANDGILLVQAESPGSTEKSTVVAHDNTIVNFGNFGFKVLNNQNTMTAYRNIVGWTGGIAAPSLRNPTLWPGNKSGAGAEVTGIQKNLEMRDSVFFRHRTMGLIVVNAAGVGGSDRFRFLNNAIVDSTNQAIIVSNAGNYPILRKNFLNQNGDPSTVEFTGSTPEFQFNNYGTYYNPPRRLFFSDTAVNIPNNYWGRPQAPDAGIVENGNINPILTEQSSFHAYNHDVMPTEVNTIWSSDLAGYGTQITVPTNGNLQGVPLSFSGQVHLDQPTNITPLNDASAYFNLLADQRAILVAQQVTLDFTFQKQEGQTPVLHRLNSSSQWVAVPGTSNMTLPNNQTKLSATLPKQDFGSWFAITGGTGGDSGGGGSPFDDLSSRWYFAEGATVDPFQTFILMANPSSESRTVRMDLLLEGLPPVVRQFVLAPNSRQTVELNDHAPKSGVSTVLTELNGKSFAAERAMYVRGPGGKWNAAHAAVGVTNPEPEWFFAEGATSHAGPAGRPFQSFILLANPTGTNLQVDVTYYPEGGAAFSEQVTLPANSRLTLEPGKRFAQLSSASFSTRVKSVNNTGILAERAMWWSDEDWTLGPFMGGHASPGLPNLSTTWYFAEGNTSGVDDFILFVNPGATETTVEIDYLMTDAKVSRFFVLAPNSRRTISVTWDELGVGNPQGRHGTSIRSTQPIAVERSMYWTRDQFGWVDGHNSLAAPLPSTVWLLPEGATVPLAVGTLRTEILLANPGKQTANVELRFLLEGQPPVLHNVAVGAERSLTVDANAITALANKGFATQVTANVPVVVERSMYFDIDIPQLIMPVGGTCSMGIAIAPVPLTRNGAWGTAGSGNDETAVMELIPTLTPTPTVTPVAH